ncbi:MAG: hypothetical protein EZS28_012620 [Streblomastix strix]|uniref:Uncharacterized protein n=1 Tax=Streblomastix strix TaxID=222440 RepID=A0A5J4WB08_9EUKA|nr:MAG: hypothetical protein EZS28_012620 [Streblomastix strix]
MIEHTPLLITIISSTVFFDYYNPSSALLTFKATSHFSVLCQSQFFKDSVTSPILITCMRTFPEANFILLLFIDHPSLNTRSELPNIIV